MKATEVILKYMEENGITYREVAGRIGSSQQNVWRVLNGSRGNDPKNGKGTTEPRYKTVVKICNALHLEIRITPIDGADDPEKSLEELESRGDISFSAVQRVLKASGYRMEIVEPGK